jgi:putative transposase
MKRSKFTQAQIAFIMRQAEEGTAIDEVCRKAGISEATFYNWRKKYAGPMPSEMERSRQLEEENGKLKKIVADLSPDKAMLPERDPPKVLKPARQADVRGRATNRAAKARQQNRDYQDQEQDCLVSLWRDRFRTLVIWNASSSRYKIARILVEESTCGECRFERPADRAVGAESAGASVPGEASTSSSCCPIAIGAVARDPAVCGWFGEQVGRRGTWPPRTHPTEYAEGLIRIAPRFASRRRPNSAFPYRNEPTPQEGGYPTAVALVMKRLAGKYGDLGLARYANLLATSAEHAGLPDAPF